MNFAEALNGLLGGKSARRKCWNSTERVLVVDVPDDTEKDKEQTYTKELHYSGGAYGDRSVEWKLHGSDILATDWELIG